jgi:hypothetical protein
LSDFSFVEYFNVSYVPYSFVTIGGNKLLVGSFFNEVFKIFNENIASNRKFELLSDDYLKLVLNRFFYVDHNDLCSIINIIEKHEGYSLGSCSDSILKSHADLVACYSSISRKSILSRRKFENRVFNEKILEIGGYEAYDMGYKLFVEDSFLKYVIDFLKIKKDFVFGCNKNYKEFFLDLFRKEVLSFSGDVVYKHKFLFDFDHGVEPMVDFDKDSFDFDKDSFDFDKDSFDFDKDSFDFDKDSFDFDKDSFDFDKDFVDKDFVDKDFVDKDFVDKDFVDKDFVGLCDDSDSFSFYIDSVDFSVQRENADFVYGDACDKGFQDNLSKKKTLVKVKKDYDEYLSNKFSTLYRCVHYLSKKSINYILRKNRSVVRDIFKKDGGFENFIARTSASLFDHGELKFDVIKFFLRSDEYGYRMFELKELVGSDLSMLKVLQKKISSLFIYKILYDFYCLRIPSNVKLYIPFFFDFRGRFYYNSAVGPTNMKYMRYAINYGVYESKDLDDPSVYN